MADQVYIVASQMNGTLQITVTKGLNEHANPHWYDLYGRLWG